MRSALQREAAQAGEGGWGGHGGGCHRGWLAPGPLPGSASGGQAQAPQPSQLRQRQPAWRGQLPLLCMFNAHVQFIQLCQAGKGVKRRLRWLRQRPQAQRAQHAQRAQRAQARCEAIPAGASHWRPDA